MSYAYQSPETFAVFASIASILIALPQVELTNKKIARGETPRRQMKEEYSQFYLEENNMKLSGFLSLFFKKKRTPAPMAAEVEPAEEAAAPVVAAPVEEYAEACPYEGGPINGVEMAEEITPTYADVRPGQINTAGYDFYNCKSFDAFIATLDMEERNQFTELFILRYKGTMPEIPDYVVGGDNAEFFRKIFIYLGQYRDRIPSGLLAKIYNYSIKL